MPKAKPKVTTPEVAKKYAEVLTDSLTQKLGLTGLARDDAHDVLWQGLTSALDEVMGEALRQVRLEREYAMELRRRVKKGSPGRADIVREQEVAVRHLEVAAGRLRGVQM